MSTDLMIAVGRSRLTKQWKNINISWENFCAKLRVTTRTRETLAEYARLSKTEQDAIKDVGGFVGGYLKDGRRIAGNVVKRCMVTLDADFGDDGMLAMLDLMYGDNAYAVYSTHKHTKEKPRLRIIFPLASAVEPDAYQAIARRIASDIGIDYFDDTTYEPSRLMYWPSTATDGEYVCHINPGELINPDTILSLYDDWRDSSTWPESSRRAAVHKKMADKQGDPLTKPGVVGAFCRAYSIPEAIDNFLPKVYTPCSTDDRYTYTAGTTTAGLVLYENGKFAYSHHGTDPVSGLLVNSFDLVRLHKFRNLDEDCVPDSRITDRPSYKAMTEMATKDPAVIAEIDKARLEQVREYFDDDEEVDTSWMADLDRHPKTGDIETTPKNVKMILENDVNLAGKIAYNEFSFRTVLLDDMPWRTMATGSVWGDVDDSCLRNYLSSVYGIKGMATVADACAEVFMRKRFHPVRDYIKSVKWDGKPRVDTLWIDYLGAEDNPYVRTVTRKHLVAAVARVFRPGCKFDNVIILCGPQGIGKSTMLKKLGRDWFSDSMTTVQGKEAYEQLHGVWISELSELYATRKAESEAVKQFLSKTEDIFRVAYGRRTSVFPRQCVFYGTTNDVTFLRDRTGNRRFWPVEVGQQEPSVSFTDFNEYAVGQVWAEAYKLYQDGESLYLDKEMEAKAIKVQQAHTEVSEKLGLIQQYLERKLPAGWQHMDLYERREFLESDEWGTEQRQKVCVLEVWCEVLGGDPKNLTGVISRDINSMLKMLSDWVQKPNPLIFGKLYGRQRGFVRRTNLDTVHGTK